MVLWFLCIWVSSSRLSPVLPGIWYSTQLVFRLFRFQREPGEGSAVWPVQLQKSMLMVLWELSFHSSSPWQHNTLLSKGTYFLYGCMRWCWSKAVGKAWEDRFLHISLWLHPNASLPELLQTGFTETETGYIFLWPPFESQITKYRLRENVGAFYLPISSKERKVCLCVTDSIFVFVYAYLEHSYIALFVY